MTAAAYLNLAARLALRAAGDVEPNPIVGAVIVKDGRVIGLGHHKRYGGLHAEREAHSDCARRGEDPRGATIYVTLEPCCHHGKQPPCTDAVIGAGIARVVAARADPNPVSAGGAAILRQAGIECVFCGESELAVRISDPFVKRITTGLPYVIAKWAQTAVGRVTVGKNDPRWISGEVSRRRVHRLRARVDAVVTGSGTAASDDPLLSGRGVRLHRVPHRVVLDSEFFLSAESKLARSARESPVLVIGSDRVVNEETAVRRAGLEAAGVVTATVHESVSGGVDLPSAMRLLAGRFGASMVLVEAGPRLLEAMFGADLVDLAIVHTAPGAAADSDPRGGEIAGVAGMLADQRRFVLCRERCSGVDSERTYRRVVSAAGN